MKLVSLYVDQFPDKDMARSVARDYKIPLFKSIAEALRFAGPRLGHLHFADSNRRAIISICEQNDPSSYLLRF